MDALREQLRDHRVLVAGAAAVAAAAYVLCRKPGATHVTQAPPHREQMTDARELKEDRVLWGRMAQHMCTHPRGRSFGQSARPALIVPTDPSIGTTEGLLAFIDARGEDIVAELHRTGAVVLRGWNVSSAAEFSAVMHRLPINSSDGFVDDFKSGGVAGLSCVGRQPRKEIAPGVFHSTSQRRFRAVMPHIELSSSQHVRPGIVAFYSHINSTPGLSETPILNMVRVAAEMDPALRTKFETTAVINHFIMPPQSQYIRVWGQNQHPWERAVDARSREHAVAIMERAGAKMGWDADGTAHTRTSTMSFGRHPVTGEWALHFSGDCWNGLLYQLYLGMYSCRYSLVGRWFYHLMYAFRFKFRWPRHDPYPSRTFFADGTTLTGDETRHLFKLFEKHTFMFEWNRGDVMLVDNLKWAHARSNLAPGGDRMLFASYANMYRAGDIETRPPRGTYGMKEQGAALHDPPIPVAAAP